MKNTFRFLLALIVAFTATVSFGQTRLTPAYFTNISVVFSNGVTTTAYSNVPSGTFSNSPIIINPGYGIGITATWTNALSTATTNLGVFVNVSYDGTNWPNPAPYFIPLGYHTAGKAFPSATNLPSSMFDGFMQARVDGVTNGDTANTVSNIVIVLSRRRLDYQ